MLLTRSGTITELFDPISLVSAVYNEAVFVASCLGVSREARKSALNGARNLKPCIYRHLCG